MKLNKITNLLLIVFAMSFFNCAYYHTRNTVYLEIDETTLHQKTWEEFKQSRNLNDSSSQLGLAYQYYTENKIPDSLRKFRFTIGQTKEGFKYYSKTPLPNEFFRVPSSKHGFDNKNNVYWINVFRYYNIKAINRIDIIEKEIPFEINSIDLGRNTIFIKNTSDSGRVKFRVISGTDTIINKINLCKNELPNTYGANIENKTLHSACLNPLTWINILFFKLFYQK